MIRKTNAKDITSLSVYLSQKLGISISDAKKKASKIVKSGLPNFIKEEKDLSGVCFVETKIVNDVKKKFVYIYVNNWRLAENFLQCLRWNLNGEYWFALPKHDTLNRTYNKNSIKFIRVDGDKNIYCFKFEKRIFKSFKSEDIDAN